jgi:CheY-like chemotaxis protein
MLEKLGCTIVMVPNGAEAFAAVKQQTFDLVLMDMHMPGTDGLQASRSIRNYERPLGKHVKIVAMTASAHDADRQACVLAGMDDFLSKPIKPSELTRLLAKIVALSNKHLPTP